MWTNKWILHVVFHGTDEELSIHHRSTGVFEVHIALDPEELIKSAVDTCG